MPLILAAAGAVAASSYPASVVTQGLQAVWDLRVGGATTVGIRSATTKTLGVDTLPSGFTYSGGFLRGTGTATMDNWDLTTIAAAGYVYTDGSGTVTFNDCKFGFHPSTTVSYSLNAGDSGSGFTVCNYCTFDGDRLNRSQPSSAVNIASSGATLTLNYCDIVDQPADGLKSIGHLVVDHCRIQNCGWYNLSDPDLVQVGGGTVDCQYTLFDVRDGGDLGDAYTGQPTNNFFRAESFGAAITGVTCKNNIMVGISGFGSIPGAYVSTDPIDVNPNAITNVDYSNNCIQKGRNNYAYSDGSSRYPYLTAGQWSDNIDFDTGATITEPLAP